MLKIHFFFSLFIIFLLCSTRIISQGVQFLNCIESSGQQSAVQGTQFTQLINTTRL